ncbi:VOC family protein [Sulfidibacter corallicola]|uniref:VOC family protein n=1 Tax=Sulfidibacter corallicola TaxID=2818388 RepID=A0A8A4TUJ3_SULCO|nr:VOC family protein [Sulfidibacter corallicola]QTD50195.1 VOC family protein [Sulfidibacter corallicola]
MIVDHLSVGVSDIDEAARFYDAVLACLDVKRMAKMDGLVAYGTDFIQFIAILPYDQQTATRGNGTHIAFRAKDKTQVDAFHEAVLAHGGSDDGAPGPRPYPHREVYATYVRDPFGNKLEALTDGFSI